MLSDLVKLEPATRLELAIQGWKPWALPLGDAGIMEPATGLEPATQ